MRNNGTRGIASVWISLAVLGLSACGGGGGGGDGGSSGSPAPAPSGNQPPTARAVASQASVPEGQPFTLDASTSTDAEGQTLTFAWSQVSGPSVTIASPNQARIELRAAEVSATASAVFRVSVSDGTSTRTADATVSFSNIAQTPVATSPFVQVADIAVPERPVQFFELDNGELFLMTEATRGGPVQVWDVTQTVTPNQVTFTLTSLLTNRIARPFASLVVRSSQLPRTLFGSTQLFIAEETLNRVVFLGVGQDGILRGGGLTLAVSQPCSLEEIFALSNRPVTVGSRNQGLSLIALDSNITGINPGDVVRQLGGANTICAHADMRDASIGAIQFADSNQFRQLDDILVYNETTRQIERYTQIGPSTIDGAQYGLAQAASPQLNTTTELRFVTGKAVSAFFASRSALALLFTDGQHQGTHRLLLAGLDQNRNIVQYTYSWPIGVPTDVTNWNFDGDSFPNVIVIAPDSPQLIVFTTSDAQEILPLAGPRFYDVGLGAAGIDTTMLGSDGRQFSVISYPDRGRVRVLEDPTP